MVHRLAALALVVALTAIAPAIAQTSLEVTPSPITFGCTLAGEDSTRTITVRNTGTDSVRILEFLAPTDFIAPPERDVDLAPGESRSFVVHFTPLSAGPSDRTAPLIINTADDQVNVPMTGIVGAEPLIGVNPTRLDFGDVSLGASRELCIEVSNPSCRPIQVLSHSIDNPAFTVTPPLATPFVLAGGARRTVCVTFAPTVSGDQSGQLIFEGELGKRAVVALNGRGVQSEIVVEPSIIDFGTLAVGAQSGEIVVEVVNRGLQTATIEAGLAISGANAGDFSFTSAPLPIDIGPTDRVPLRIRFRPTGLGARTARIVVNNSSDTDPVIELRGRGSLFDVTVAPDSVDMGDLLVGRRRTALDTVIVTNRGSDPIRVDSTTLEGADRAAFAIYGFVIASIDPNSTYELDVEFKPYAPRVFHADLVIHLAGGTRLRVALRGRGLDTAAPRARLIVGDSVHARVGERRMLRFAIEPPLGPPDTATRAVVRLTLDPLSLYPHRVIAEGATATRSYRADGTVELIFSSVETLVLDHFDLEIEGLFTGQARNLVRVDSADLGDPRITVTSSPGVATLEGCDVDRGDTVLQRITIVRVSPNPGGPRMQLTYVASEAARGRIISIDGRVVQDFDVASTGGATGTIELPIDGLDDGSYLMEVRTGASVDRCMVQVRR